MARQPHAPVSVLVVDDDDDVREGLCELLEFEGYRARGVADGGEALDELALNDAADVVLLDLRMPKMDGYEFLRRQAVAHSPIREVPVIVVSATLEKALPCSVAAVFSKPVNLDLLLAALRRQVVRLNIG